ncbi:MAG: mannose-1-phosphate guanylyltransferase/mannose-6-phosphate isomerase, partial [Moraxellaceae bacterium]
MTLLPVIMAGGSGTRLWPLSRELHPKQFLTLPGQQFSMLQMTVQRLEGLESRLPLVISNESHRFIAAEQLRQLDKLAHNILLEPEGRNTAPAIALAALRAQADGDDPLLLVLAADHLIADTAAFKACIRRAIPLAESGKLVTFGIVPTHAETGYGYIQRGEALQEGAFRVAAFVEKPDLATAEGYVASGNYDWNSGMFLFRASVLLAELARFRPDILTACKQAMQVQHTDLDFIRIDSEAFSRCPSESIDYAVMEKTDRAAVVPMTAGWSDVGAFSSLWEVSEKNADGNALRGDVLALDTHNSLIDAENALVATIGLRDAVVVQTKDAVLV